MSRAELNYDSGEYKNIHYGDVLIKYGPVLNANSVGIPYITEHKKYKDDSSLMEGDIIIADTAEDQAVGKATEIINIGNQKIVSGLHTIACRPLIKMVPTYLGFYLNAENYHKQLYPLMQGVKVLSISKSNISETIINYPQPSEQEKICSLLNLLESRIVKQQKLIDSLKKYKRGVMNSYFGRNLTFHCFNSEWRPLSLSDACEEFKSGKSITSSQISETGEYAVYGGNGVRGFTNHYSHNGQYVVVGRQGALCGNVQMIDGKNYLSEHAIAVKANDNNYTPFLLYILTDMRLGQYSDQGAQPGLAVNKLLRLKRNFPEYEEQVHFATIMQKLDKKLSKEEETLESIIALKHGLLQQLFI